MKIVQFDMYLIKLKASIQLHTVHNIKIFVLNLSHNHLCGT